MMARGFPIRLKKLAEEADRSLSVPAGLHQNIKNITVAIGPTPKPMLLAADHDDDFVQVPFVRG